MYAGKSLFDWDFGDGEELMRAEMFGESEDCVGEVSSYFPVPLRDSMFYALVDG